MPYHYNTIVATGKNQPLTTWQTPDAALCQAKPKMLLAPAGKVRAWQGQDERQNCDVYFLGCGVCTENAQDHCEVWMVKPGRVPDQLAPIQAAAPAPMQPKVGTLDKNFEYFTEEDYLDRGMQGPRMGPPDARKPTRDERHSRTETRPVRAAPAFSVDSLTLARTSKRPKYSPS